VGVKGLIVASDPVRPATGHGRGTSTVWWLMAEGWIDRWNRSLADAVQFPVLSPVDVTDVTMRCTGAT